MEYNTNVDIVGAGSAELADNLDFSQVANAKDQGTIFALPQELKKDEHAPYHSFEAPSQSLAKFHTTDMPTWIVALGGKSNDDYRAYSVQKTSDDGFVITGNFVVTPVTNADIFLAKVNNVGIPLWTKVLGGGGDKL